MGGRRRFKGKEKKKSQRKTDRGEKRGAEKVGGKKGERRKTRGEIGAPWHSWLKTLSIIFGAGLNKEVGRTGWLWTPGWFNTGAWIRACRSMTTQGNRRHFFLFSFSVRGKSFFFSPLVFKAASKQDQDRSPLICSYCGDVWQDQLDLTCWPECLKPHLLHLSNF